MAWRATGAEIGRTYFLALLAEAYGIMGQPEAGLTAIAEALTLADTTEDVTTSQSDRLKGELLLQQSLDHQVEAEACCHRVIQFSME